MNNQPKHWNYLRGDIISKVVVTICVCLMIFGLGAQMRINADNAMTLEDHYRLTISKNSKTFEDLVPLMEKSTQEYELAHNQAVIAETEASRLRQVADNKNATVKEIEGQMKELNTINNELRQKIETRQVITNNPGVKVHATSYNPEVGQTDSSPCHAGGTGINVCDSFEAGDRPIALSQELTAWSQKGKMRVAMDCGDACITFEPGEKVFAVSELDDPRCNGVFTVSDALNVRYTKRGDIFFLNRADNISCDMTIYKLTE